MNLPEIESIDMVFFYGNEKGDSASCGVFYKPNRPKTAKQYFREMGFSVYITPEPDFTIPLADREELLFFDWGADTDSDPGYKLLFTENSTIDIHFTYRTISAREEKREFVREVMQNTRIATVNGIIGG